MMDCPCQSLRGMGAFTDSLQQSLYLMAQGCWLYG